MIWVVVIDEDVSDAIRVTHGAGDVDVTHSVDSTLGGLKAEVARLMRCDPSQRMVSDIAMCNGRAVPEMSEDNALTLRAMHIRFRRIANVESEDDELKDVQYDQA